MNQTSKTEFTKKIIWSVLALYGAYTIVSDIVGYYAEKYAFIPVILEKSPIKMKNGDESIRLLHNKMKEGNETVRYRDVMIDERMNNAVDKYNESLKRLESLGFFESVFSHKGIEYFYNYFYSVGEINEISKTQLIFLQKRYGINAKSGHNAEIDKNITK